MSSAPMLPSESRRIKDMLQPLMALNPKIFWTDLLTSATLGWSAFFAAVFSEPFSAQQVIAILAASLLLYRGQTFIHELTHSHGRIKGFETAYNLLFGYPNKLPAYIYEPHAFHHGRSTFGTESDPEYMGFAGRSPVLVLAGPFILSALLPLLLLIRFTLIPLAYPLLKREWKLAIFQHASTLVMNPLYKRPFRNERELRQMVREDGLCAAYTLAVIGLIVSGWLPLQTIVLWAVTVAIGSTMNMIRSKLNHRYDHPSEHKTFEEHLRDSVTIDTGLWSEIWAPLGLAYHTIHHVAPALPYHNLRRAHQLLMRELGPEHIYAGTVHASAPSAIRSLISVCRSVERAGSAK